MLKKLDKIFLSISVFAFLFFSLLYTFSFSIGFVYADTVTRDTSVMEDLSKDDSFDKSDYPSLSLTQFKKVNTNDNKADDIKEIYVIQIAEGISNELFIYTFEPISPSLTMNASRIGFSCKLSTNGKTTDVNYKELELISREGVYAKYKVKDFSVTTDSKRYYFITAVYFKPTSEYFELFPNLNSQISSRVCSVAQQWCAYDENGNIKYEMNTFDVVEYEVDFAGSIRLTGGFSLRDYFVLKQQESCDLYFLSFSVKNYKIDYLYDASLFYKSTFVEKTTDFWGRIEITKSEPTPKTAYLSNIEPAHMSGTFVSGKQLERKYKWDTIYKSSNFLNSDYGKSLSSEAKTAVASSEFTFCFAATPVTYPTNIDYYYSTYYEITDVSIIRLHFFSMGRAYDLDAVGDIVDIDSIPDGGVTADGSCKNFEVIKIIIAILGGVLLIRFPFVSFPQIGHFNSLLINFLLKYKKCNFDNKLLPHKPIFIGRQKKHFLPKKAPIKINKICVVLI